MSCNLGEKKAEEGRDRVGERRQLDPPTQRSNKEADHCTRSFYELGGKDSISCSVSKCVDTEVI